MPAAKLTARDRCDHCGAQAYTAWWHPIVKGLLMFCAHHNRANEHSLTDHKWLLTIDDRDRLIVPDLPSLTADPATH